MSKQLSVSEVRTIVGSVQLKEQFHITVKPEAYEACCVEIRDTQYGNLVWRKRSFEPNFESELKRKLDMHS